MRYKRILLVDTCTSFGGVAIYLGGVVQLIDGKAKLYAICGDSDLARLLRERGVQSSVLKYAERRSKSLLIMFSALAIPYMRLRYGISTIWLTGNSEVVLLPLVRLLGCTGIVTRHLTLRDETAEWRGTPRKKISHILFMRLAFLAAKIICVSRSVADDLATFVPQRKLVVIPNWVPVLPVLQAKTFRPQNEPLRLLFVGRLEEYKGCSVLLQALHSLNVQDGHIAVSLTVVGAGEYRNELEREAEGLDVRFVGFQKDTEPFYRDADIFVNPSKGPEGLPLVSLEAMSYGLPCIFSDLLVHQEITDNGKYALLFRSADADDLSMKIKSLLRSRRRLERYGSLAREVIESRHTAKIAQACYLKQLGIEP
jgi:glycosyltransferase involved in cell wall biosynthesis